MTQSRRPNAQQHRARPTTTPARTAHDSRPENDEEKITYIEFINKLMHRMKMDGVKKMLDHALDELD